MKQKKNIRDHETESGDKTTHQERSNWALKTAIMSHWAGGEWRDDMGQEEEGEYP